MADRATNTPIPEVSVEELAQRLGDASEPVQLIDVREPQEVEIARVEGFEVLPLSQFEQWSGQIGDRFDPQVETFVMCHHGMRSYQMCQWLHSQGFTQVRNVAGGIDAYALLVDSSIPKY